MPTQAPQGRVAPRPHGVVATVAGRGAVAAGTCAPFGEELILVKGKVRVLA